FFLGRVLPETLEVALAERIQLVRRFTGVLCALASRHLFRVDVVVGDAAVCDESTGPYKAVSVKPLRLMVESNSHLLNGWTQTATTSRQGCVGTPSSWSSSLAVGIQNEIRPRSTS